MTPTPAGGARRVPAGPAAAGPAAVDPAAVDPATPDPATPDPAAVDPEAVDPEAVDPEAVDPGPAELGYEQARDELLEIVRRLEAGAGTLEESLQLWERGEALAARCEEWLAGARARMDALVAARPPAETPVDGAGAGGTVGRGGRVGRA